MGRGWCGFINQESRMKTQGTRSKGSRNSFGDSLGEGTRKKKQRTRKEQERRNRKQESFKLQVSSVVGWGGLS